MLCKEFGWTYNELMNQPHDFVLNCLEYLEQVAIKRNKK